MTYSLFQNTCGAMLAKGALRNVFIKRQWFPIPDRSSLPEALEGTAKDHFLASDYVMQPAWMVAPLYIQARAHLHQTHQLRGGRGGGEGGWEGSGGGWEGAKERGW